MHCSYGCIQLTKNTPLIIYFQDDLKHSCLVYCWLTGARVEASGQRKQATENHYQGTCPLETEAGCNWNKMTFDFIHLFILHPPPFLLSPSKIQDSANYFQLAQEQYHEIQTNREVLRSPEQIRKTFNKFMGTLRQAEEVLVLPQLPNMQEIYAAEMRVR